MLILLTKVLLSPVLLSICVFAARRWGTSVAGLLLGLPLVSGPVSFFLLSEHGPSFAENAARGTMFGLVATGVFCVTYQRISDSTRWWQSLPVAGSTCLGSIYLLSHMHLSLVDSVLLAAVLLAGLVIAADAPSRSAGTPPTSKRALGFRMAIASSVVLAVTMGAGLLGSQLSGMFAAVPVIIAIMTATSHRTVGSDSANGLLGATVNGLWGAVAFFAVVAFLVTVATPTVTYLVASLAALVAGFLGMRIPRVLTNATAPGVTI